jgi:hypothetical protein
VNSHLFAYLRFALYTSHTGDGSRLPLSHFGGSGEPAAEVGLMAPDCTVGMRDEESSLTALVGKGGPPEAHPAGVPQHPRPPQRELRQRAVFDSGGDLIGYVANVYVDEERNYRFVDIAVGGLSA